jgi:uncharacterized membrane protein YozB (DUF420 family)
VLTPEVVILCLKIAVGAVTLLLLASLTALYFKNYRLHGRINLVYFILTVTALVVFEGIVQVYDRDIFKRIWDDPVAGYWLRVHLCFAVPSALLMPVMLFSGLKGRSKLHVTLSFLFAVLWTGTFVTGIFYVHVP